MQKTICIIKMIRFFGDALMLGIFLLMVWLFVSAYLNENFTCIVNINRYGEAHVEMILLVFILFPLFLITSTFSYLDLHRTISTRREPEFKEGLSYHLNEEYFPGEHVKCPSCFGVFYARIPYYSRIYCPVCGAVGRYDPDGDYPFY